MPETSLAPWAHPDPDPETLPDTLPADLELQTETASRILRAALRAEESAEALEERMKADQAAWAALILRQRDRAAAWRESVRAWMLGHDVKQLKTPWYTASIGKGRTKVVVDDAALAIRALRTLGAETAICTTERIVKQEFDAIFQARPTIFEGAAHEETSEPGLIIRKAKE